MDKNEFIKSIAKYVQIYAPKYGIKVCSPIIAQACLESAFGTSNKAKYNNFFGLKYRKNRVTCNNGYFYDGGSEQNDDGSYTLLPSDTSWYAFDNMEKGVEGYFQFINISNYSNLKGVTDPLTYLQNIKADGYASSKEYVQNVYRVVTTYNLTQYDNIKQDTTNQATRNIKVAIDAGHGSNTSGKRHPDGYREHYSNTQTAYYLSQILEKNGISVLKVSWDDLDGTNDPDISLANRQSMIKSFGADISVSIHANAYGDGKSYNNANGVETYFHSNSSKAKDSKKLAQLVQSELIKNTSQSNRGVKSSELALCNAAAMGTRASILIETAFMTNQRESDLLKSTNFMIECAKEIATGIFNYFGIKGNVDFSFMGSNNQNNTTTKPENNSNTKPNTTPSTPNNNATTNTEYKYNGLDYSKVFDANYYALKYLDLQIAFKFDKTKLFNHFTKYGMKEGRQGIKTFNVKVYKDNNADLRQAFGNDLPSYYKHYIQYGYKEGRKCY